MPCSRSPWGVPLPGGVPAPGGGGSAPRGVCSWGWSGPGGGLLLGGLLPEGCGDPPESRWPLLQTVRILLECILVMSTFTLSGKCVKQECIPGGCLPLALVAATRCRY